MFPSPRRRGTLDDQAATVPRPNLSGARRSLVNHIYTASAYSGSENRAIGRVLIGKPLLTSKVGRAKRRDRLQNGALNTRA